jgi:hypothetical protein
VLAACVFHVGVARSADAKRALMQAGVPVRPPADNPVGRPPALAEARP